MAIATFHKQPTELYTIGMEYSGRLPSGASLASGTVSALNLSDGTDASATVLDTTTATISGTQALRKVRAGTSGISYKITFVVTLDTNDVLEDDIIMVVTNL